MASAIIPYDTYEQLKGLISLPDNHIVADDREGRYMIICPDATNSRPIIWGKALDYRNKPISKGLGG